MDYSNHYGNHFDIRRENMYPTPYQNTTVLPLLLLSLATQKHSPDTTSHIQKEYDFIIVGAGSAGSVVAARLSELVDKTSILLEAGYPPPLLTEIPGITRSFLKSDIDWNYLTVPQKYTGAGLINRQLTFPSGKGFGGSSILNAMLAIRGHREDYDNWERLGAKGWSWKGVLPYFIKLEDNADEDIACNGFHGVGGPVTTSRNPYKPALQKAILEGGHHLGYPCGDPNTGIEYGFGDFQSTLRNGQTCGSAKAYLVPCDNRKNLDIVSGAHVTKVLFNGKTAVGVEFERKGRRYKVRARKEVIICAGALNTPQLLILSGIGPRNTLRHFKIPEVANLPVGLNFQDHCMAILNFVVNAPIQPYREKLRNPTNVKLYIKHRVGPLASGEGLPILAFFPNDDCDDPATPPDHEIYFMEALDSSAKTQLDIKPSVYKQIYGPYENCTIVWCMSSPIRPKSRGCVSIRSTDPCDPPVIDPNYFEHPDDLHDVVSGLKNCLRITETPPVRKLGLQPFETVVPGCAKFLHSEDAYLECMARSIVMTASHPSGTAKMGDPRDPTTVVDPELRVKGVNGLRVVDASIMPTLISGNPNLPTIMIGEKASDIIKESISCH